MPIATAPALDHPHKKAHSPGLRWAAVALTGCALVVAMMEAGARFAVPRISQIERRTVTEYRGAIAPRGDRPYVLVVGNSLLGAALDMNSVTQTLGGKLDVRRFLVEQTSYEDWYFALRRLFRNGARPDAVVVILSPGQLSASGVRGEYFAYRMLDSRDIWRAARDLDLSPTAAVNLAVGNVSAFFGLRSEIRKVLLGRLQPEAPLLMQRLATGKAAPRPPEAVLKDATARLAALRHVVEERGGRLYYMLPPQLERDGLDLALRQAGDATGVPVIVPVAPGELDGSFFSDGFHVNAQGAAVFTTRFTRQLPAALSPRDTARQ